MNKLKPTLVTQMLVFAGLCSLICSWLLNQFSTTDVLSATLYPREAQMLLMMGVYFLLLALAILSYRILRR